MNVNKVTLGGRIVAEPERRYSQSKDRMAVTSFAVAVNRRGQDAGADFINCVAFGNVGEVVAKHFHKGSNILLFGSLNIDSYTDKEGNKRYTTKVLVSEIQFVDAKKSDSNSREESAPVAKQATEKPKARKKTAEPEYEEYEDEDDLPF